jgi:Fungal Zn(2)-Cys(6) binuclear cluster domain
MDFTTSSPAPIGLFEYHQEEPSLTSKPAPHKRNRTQLSCTNCRQAKLKCDRQRPYCSQCVKKGRASLCTFPSPVTRKKPTVSMQNRLKHLESLVKDVMTVQTPSIQQGHMGPHHSDEESTSNDHLRSALFDGPIHNTDATPIASASSVLLGSSESTYVGATHWAAILEDVRFSQQAYKQQHLNKLRSMK